MREIDQTIREALGPDNAKLFDAFGEQRLYERVLDSFRGEARWLVALTFVATTVFVVLAVLATSHFLQAGDLTEQLTWAVAVGFCVFAVGLLKVWYWMELNKNTVMRELKRLELQIARLSGELRRRVDTGVHHG